MDLREAPDRLPIMLATLEEFRRISGEPDYHACFSSTKSFARGSHSVSMKRCPAHLLSSNASAGGESTQAGAGARREA